jgi:hypothetical protein
MSYSKDQLSSILDEIAGFEVELAEDPTVPTLGVKYLNERVAVCRKYLNRVIYYVQTVGKQVKNLNVEVRHMELDLELKMAQKLADDVLVKKQPSIDDRKALATMLLKEENDNLAVLRLELLDAFETLKIIKMKHQDLVRTNGDIKSQRQLVKDDMESRLSGGPGYDPPQTKQDKSVPDGMPPPIVPGKIDPQDLLDPAKRPDDMPEPVDEMHAAMISDFFGSKPPPVLIKGPVESEESEEDALPKPREYDDDGVATRDGSMSFDDV